MRTKKILTQRRVPVRRVRVINNWWLKFARISHLASLFSRKIKMNFWDKVRIQEYTLGIISRPKSPLNSIVKLQWTHLSENLPSTTESWLNSWRTQVYSRLWEPFSAQLDHRKPIVIWSKRNGTAYWLNMLPSARSAKCYSRTNLTTNGASLTNFRLPYKSHKQSTSYTKVIWKHSIETLKLIIY